MNLEILTEILINHKKWLQAGGHRLDRRRADLSHADLRQAFLVGVDLSRANLHEADLRSANLNQANVSGAWLVGANLSSADLSGADLSGAVLQRANLNHTNLSGAILQEAELHQADLRWASLNQADLSGASLNDSILCWTDLRKSNLCGANLQGTNLRSAAMNGADLSGAILPHFSIVPEEGAFIGWMQCKDNIVKLEIPADARRASFLTSRKCRASKIRVLEVLSPEGTPCPDTIARGLCGVITDFKYEEGRIVEAPAFSELITTSYAPGIYFFMTKEEVIQL